MPRKLTAVEIVAVIVVSAIMLLAIFMFVMAMVDTFNRHLLHEEGVTIQQSWMAALVIGLIANVATRALFKHLNTVYPRRSQTR